eukprot:9964061-Heterocapsa_arctica.AAC.1
MLVRNCMEADDQPLASHKPICGLGVWPLLQQRRHYDMQADIIHPILHKTAHHTLPFAPYITSHLMHRTSCPHTSYIVNRSDGGRPASRGSSSSSRSSEVLCASG